MLPPKKSTAKKTNPVRKYKKPSSGDSLVEDVFEIFDPTGISSYDDVYRSYQKNGLLSLETGLEVLGALPIIGKAGKAIKGVRTANKYIKALNKVNKVVVKTEKVVPTILKEGTTFGKAAQKVSKGGKANPIAAASIVVGEGAKAFEKGIKVVEKGTSKAVEKVIAKAPKKQDAINTTAATLNTINTLSDVAGATQNQLIEPIVQKQKDKEYQPISKKVIYYNTDPERGPVEKPGTESNTSYTPITNSAQLKKWKEQQLAYGTNSQGIMKRKMNPNKKYANGTNANGMDPNNYIISPAEAMNDYNIMLAKAESEALSNPWLPITAMAGGLMQQGIGMAGSFTGGGATPNPSGAKGVMAGATAANGMNNVEGDVEVEGGEMYETPQGEVGEFEGPSHEEGGIPLEVGQDVEQGTKVYSDRLKVGDKTLAERKEARERRTANLEKAAAQPLIDVATKNALKRKMEAIQKEEMADLQFQEQVNNIQAMADTMVKAFGTGAAGIQKYGNGTDPLGLRKKKVNPYANSANYETDGIKNLHDALGIASTEQGYGTAIGPKTLEKLKPYMKSSWVNSMQELTPNSNPNYYSNLYDSDPKSTALFEKNTLLALKGEKPKNKRDNNKSYTEDLYKSLGLTPEGAKYKGPQSTYFTDMGKNLPADLSLAEVTPESMFANYQDATDVDPLAMTAGEDWAKANPLPSSIEEEMPASIFGTGSRQFGKFEGEVPEHFKGKMDTPAKEGKFMQALGENTPAIGDMTKLIGNYLGMTAGMKNAAEQRSTDVTHRNTFANAGEESQRLLDNAKKGIEISKAQAIQKATTVGRGGKRGARGSARGVNQMRAMDWLYDTALQSQIADISAKTAEQISGIDIQKSGVAMNADQLKGQGEYQAAMANEAAKDAFYTAMGLGKKDFATGVQQTGKDLNDMKQNKIIENLMKEYGTYFTGDRSGIKAKSYEELTKGKEDKKATTVSENLEVKIDTEGNEYVIIGGKKQLIKRK